MQAYKEPPQDMVCKDKFLIQSTAVPAETTDEDITASMVSKHIKGTTDTDIQHYFELHQRNNTIQTS